jgi:formylglycine-generating enzyme required for sulfatase activity
MRKKALKNAVRRALRGGSFNYGTWGLRTSYRYGYGPVDRDWSYGFRLIARKVR